VGAWFAAFCGRHGVAAQPKGAAKPVKGSGRGKAKKKRKAMKSVERDGASEAGGEAAAAAADVRSFQQPTALRCSQLCVARGVLQHSLRAYSATADAQRQHSAKRIVHLPRNMSTR
jgi:hypothetical protein